jgi:hypothetical protein
LGEHAKSPPRFLIVGERGGFRCIKSANVNTLDTCRPTVSPSAHSDAFVAGAVVGTSFGILCVLAACRMPKIHAAKIEAITITVVDLYAFGWLSDESMQINLVGITSGKC